MSGATAFRHGRIWTGRRFVEALAVEDGRVVAAGTDAEVGRQRPQGAATVELAGRLVLPGFLDAHLHVTLMALRRDGVDLRGCRTLDEVGDRIRAWAVTHPTGPIWGGGLDDESLVERRLPSRAELDRWAADRPLTLARICEHTALLNSAGLDVVGLTTATPDPSGGTFGREPSGELTGRLSERALAVLERFPFPSLEERPELGTAVLQEAAGAGLVAVASLRAGPRELRWARQHGRGPGRPRYLAFGRVDSVEEIAAWGRWRRAGDAALAGVKLMADGSFGARTAWLERPYDDSPATAGGPVFAEAAWDDALRAADAEGLRVAAHALGDRAVRTVLTALERVRPSHRPRVEHAGLVPPELLGRLRAVGADVVVQPGFRRSDPWLGARVGPARLRWAYPLADLRRSGLSLAGSSDAPIEPLDPLDGIRCAAADGFVGQALGPAEALELYGAGAARVLDLPELGHLEPGASASLVLLEARGLGDLVAPRPPPIRGTWIDGVRAA